MRERKISGIKRWKISGFSDMIEGMLHRAAGICGPEA